MQVEPAGQGQARAAEVRGKTYHKRLARATKSLKARSKIKRLKIEVRMATLPKPAGETLDRSAAVESAVASFRMEGLEPDAETVALLEAFSSGRHSIVEFGAAIERHAARLRSGQSVKSIS